MALPVSLLLIAAGAILAWGVTGKAEGLNLDAIGAILIVIGILGFLLSLFLWDSWGPGAWRRSATYVEGDPATYRRGRWPARRRATYVEEEAGPPAPPAAGPPVDPPL